MLLGAHESIAGGLHRAIHFAVEDGCQALQVFTKNASQWREPTLSSAQIDAFRQARARSVLSQTPVLSHDSYLINLCAKEPEHLERSRQSFLQEVVRCAALGIDFVVFHPGAHGGLGPDAAIESVVKQLVWILERTTGLPTGLLVENTAGQGSAIGVTFEEVGAILRGIEQTVGTRHSARVGMCLDTCHALAAGYPLHTIEGYDEVWALIDTHVGIERVRAIHLNDSKKGLGARVDRHEWIGQGELGFYPFWRLVNDPRLSYVVGVLETPPRDKDRGYSQQLSQLRALIGAPCPACRTPQLAKDDPSSRLAKKGAEPHRKA